MSRVQPGCGATRLCARRPSLDGAAPGLVGLAGRIFARRVLLFDGSMARRRRRAIPSLAIATAVDLIEQGQRMRVTAPGVPEFATVRFAKPLMRAVSRPSSS